MSNEFYGVKVNAGRVRSMLKIIDAMLELLTKKHYCDISVTEVCETALVTRKTFYRHFDSKRQVVESALDTMFLEMNSKFDFAEVEAKQVIKFAFDYLAENRRLANVFLDKDLFDVLCRKVIEYVEIAYDDTLHSSASFDPSLSEFYHTFIAVGITSLVKTWVRGGLKQSPETLTALTRRLLSGVIK